MCAIRTSLLAAGAAALLSTQAAYAAPASSMPAIDPLVSLSVLGTAQSRAAVCAAGGAAAAAGAALATSQVMPSNPTCVFPVTDAAPPPVAPPLAPAVAPPPPGKEIGWLPIALGALLLAGIVVALTLLDDNGDGDLEPVSPV